MSVTSKKACGGLLLDHAKLHVLRGGGGGGEGGVVRGGLTCTSETRLCMYTWCTDQDNSHTVQDLTPGMSSGVTSPPVP